MSEVNNNLGTLKSKIIEIIADCSGEIDQNAKSVQKWFSSGEYLKELQKYKESQETEEKMDSIVEKLRELLPWEAVLPTEKITNPISGPNSDCTSENTHHLDGFLYDDTEVYKMLEDKDIKQRFCSDCGSRNIEDINVISHSLSRQKLQYVFKVLLPKDCSASKILDVGSRIGAVLYGAYFYTNAAQIFGIELNKELCDIQNKIVSAHDMASRIKVVNGDISKQEDIVATSDIVILNNVFEFFMDRDAQIKIWRFLKKTLKKGTIVITVPSLEESLDDLDIYEEFSNWIEKIPAYQENNMHFDEETMLSFHDIYLYTVK